MVSGSLLGESGGGAVWRQGDTVVVIQFAGDRVAGKQIVRGRAIGLLDWLKPGFSAMNKGDPAGSPFYCHASPCRAGGARWARSSRGVMPKWLR